jgi:hypothetical protein
VRPQKGARLSNGEKVPMAEAIVLLIILVALWGISRVKPHGPEV